MTKLATFIHAHNTPHCDQSRTDNKKKDMNFKYLLASSKLQFN